MLLHHGISTIINLYALVVSLYRYKVHNNSREPTPKLPPTSLLSFLPYKFPILRKIIIFVMYELSHRQIHTREGNNQKVITSSPLICPSNLAKIPRTFSSGLSAGLSLSVGAFLRKIRVSERPRYCPRDFDLSSLSMNFNILVRELNFCFLATSSLCPVASV